MSSRTSESHANLEIYQHAGIWIWVDMCAFEHQGEPHGKLRLALQTHHNRFLDLTDPGSQIFLHFFFFFMESCSVNL